MPENRIDPQNRESENVENNETTDSSENTERFESDTQKIVRRHLENQDDVITDEDIANVRIGMTPPEFDRATEARFEDEESKDEVEEEFIGEDGNNEEKTGKDRITPWDTIDPEN